MTSAHFLCPCSTPPPPPPPSPLKSVLRGFDRTLPTCCKCCMLISGWGAASGGLAATEVLLVDPELSGADPSFSLITASPFIMWYKMDNMDSAIWGPYSLGSLWPQSCWTAENAFWKKKNANVHPHLTCDRALFFPTVREKWEIKLTNPAMKTFHIPFA